MKILSKKQIIFLHEHLINATGGTEGIKDEGMLESAMNAPFQTFGGEDLFPTIYQKAARLGFGLASNHPFLDGNKRIGAHAMLTFLEINGVEMQYTNKELSDIFLAIADNQVNYDDLLSWLIEHVVWR